MDVPQAPQDTELRNIIDKLAQFVARNGLEFELMTKNKQKGNPKFQFLYGGEYFNYYQYKVSAEQELFKQQQQQGTVLPDQENSWNPPNQMQHSAEIEQINKQQDTLREQIKQSEHNLTAQHTVLLQQQQTQIEQTVKRCEIADLQREATKCEVVLNDIYGILQPIIDSCTKDSISNGKSWFLQHATTKEKADCIVECLLYKVLRTTVFTQKLHVIYLVNDLLHHSARKNASDLKEALERVVVPMFCNASITATAEQKQKLDKLLKLWESKTNYLKVDTLERMRNPVQSYTQYQADQVAKYQSEVSSLSQQTKVTYDGYQAQHQAFVCHAMQQIMDLQQQKQTLEQQAITQPTPPQAPSSTLPLETIQQSLQQTIQSLSHSTPQQAFPIPTINSHQNDNYIDMNISIPPPSQMNQHGMNQSYSSNNTSMPVFPATPDLNQNGVDSMSFSQPPPGYFPTPGIFPDFSKPPPGFVSPPEPYVDDLMPSAPYYELPVGLTVPLVKLEETTYKPLDPKDIRLPPPAPPSERLLAAVEAFFSLPNHDRPRDSNLNLMHNPVQELDPSNKGHQMLKKMGWGGSGLGANEQGIDTPISGGDVRDRQDQFKGVGCNLNDPYENFRKNKGAAFITRMKARAEERAAERKDIDLPGFFLFD
ncbi:unnamed protein product [Diabrotica balteata]|uniref:Calcium homeostasis endoplasmic reticulum protein n=1 Tax=Diabrotica balteata TaxID=107213 RepID=A0A9N9X8C6_DIABA|nr:unnamed protein product [Diabrotica balteata]